MKSMFKKEELKSIKTKLRSLRDKISKLENHNETKNHDETTKQDSERDFETEIINENKVSEENKQKIIEFKPQQTTTDKKNKLKKEILQTIRNENLTGGEVKQKIVDQARLCSKASFYRYIQELKKEGKIESITINNQEFLYSKV